MTEDEIYRTSTQYRLWSFTPKSLHSLRSKTNSLAAEGVFTAIRTAADSGKAVAKADPKEANSNGVNSSSPPTVQASQALHEVEYLTVEEEQKLVGFYCIKAMEFADFCDFPTNVKATAVQYLKRFYLSNSPMTYHPKEIMPSALFLSTKTENHYISLRFFVSKLQKTTAEDVVAPEFLLTQGLRFTFDIRHPQRGLEGGFMELLSLAMGNGYNYPPFGPSADGEKIAASRLKDKMLCIPPLSRGIKEGETIKAVKPEQLISRIQTAHGVAKEILKTSALLTDAYFHYTPSQIWLASVLTADPPLFHFYFDLKFPSPYSTSSPSNNPHKSRILSTLQECSILLKSSTSTKPAQTEMDEFKRIDKKLYKCRNPEKVDLVGINKAVKRNSGNGVEGVDEKVVKKRKLERERSEKEGVEIFGGPLV